MSEDFDGWAAVDVAYSSKIHYFVHGRSMCLKYGFIRGMCCAMDYENNSWPNDHEDNCATCKKKLERKLAREASR